MWKSVCCCPAVLMVLNVAVARADTPAVQPAAPATQSTEPVRVNGLDFQIVGATNWLVPANDTETTIPLALCVTGRTEEAVTLNLFDTITIHLKDAAGKELRIDGGRKGTRPCPPLLLKKGQNGTVDRTAKLQPLAGKPGQFRLIGSDGAGGIWYFGGMRTGKYTISMTYDNAKGRWDDKEPPLWIGKAATKELAVEITDEPAATQPAVSSKPVEKDGLAVTVALPKATIVAGGPLNFTVEFKNVSDKPFGLLNADGYHYRDWRIRFKKQGQGDWGEFGFDQAGKLKLTVAQVEPGRTLTVPVVLEGTDLTGVARILSGGKQEHLKPGKYLLSVTMDQRDNADNDPKPAVRYWAGTIATEPVEFEITGKPDDTQL